MSTTHSSIMRRPLGDIRATLSHLGVYEPVIDALVEAAAGPDGDAVEVCIKNLLHTQMNPAQLDEEELDSLLSYVPAIASTFVAFDNSDIELYRVARMALAYAVGEHDVPGNHILNMTTDGFLMDGILGATMHACVEAEYVSPGSEELEWLGQNHRQLLPFAALIREREDISREFCEILLSEHENGTSPVLQLGIL